MITDYSAEVIVSESSKTRLKRMLMQERLVDKNASMPALESLKDDINLSDVYFGTGLANAKEITSGIPFDFLVYPLLARKIRNNLGNGHIHHLIADKHALLNKFEEDAIRVRAQECRKMMESIAYNIGIENYHIYFSSEISNDASYKVLLDKIDASSFSNRYAMFESVDIEYFHQTRQVILKLGWKFNGESSFDERSFDRQYSNFYGDKIIPIYTPAGKRFTNTNFDTVPYMLSKEDINFRLVISKDEDVLNKVKSLTCSKETMQMCINHYKAIIRLFEEATYKIPAGFNSIWEKIQFIIQFITN